MALLVLPAHHVSLLVMLILDDEDHIKTGQNGGHEIDVVLALRVVPSAEHRVSSRQYRASRVQSSSNSSL